MRRLQTYGSVHGGVLRISRRNNFDEAIKLMEGCRVAVTVEKLYHKRSILTENGTGQNGYYFGIVVSLYRDGAWDTQQRQLTIQQAHEELKQNCAYVERYNDETGLIMRSVQSTAEMTTVQFEEYLTRCREFIAEWFGIRVPLPNEQTELELTTA